MRTRIPTPTCRCSAPLAIPWRCHPILTSIGSHAGAAGRSKSGGCRRACHASASRSRRGGRAVALALEFYRSAPKYLGARALGSKAPKVLADGLLTGGLAPLRLVTQKDPAPTREGWGRVKPRLSGICGSDLSTISGRSSLYFSPLVSLPFVPGHEVVGELLDDVGDLVTGQRVVISKIGR